MSIVNNDINYIYHQTLMTLDKLSLTLKQLCDVTSVSALVTRWQMTHWLGILYIDDCHMTGSLVCHQWLCCTSHQPSPQCCWQFNIIWLPDFGNLLCQEKQSNDSGLASLWLHILINLQRIVEPLSYELALAVVFGISSDS